MERAHQMISGDGLQIPLPLMQRYGLQPGTQVVLELGAEGIRVLPALAQRPKIESQALRHLLRHLGDAVTIEARQREGAWRVTVFASGGLRPIGELIYDLAGDFLEKPSTPLETMRHRAVEIMGDQYS